MSPDTQGPRPFGGPGVFLPTGQQSAAFDAQAIETAGVPQETLMENAGRSAALVLQRLHPRGEVVVVAGSGNNGGDGLVLARTLASWGRPVRILRGTGRPLARPLLHGWPVEIDAPEPGDPDGLDFALEGGAVIVDALLGTGARGAPREGPAAWIRAMNRSVAPVVSLDLPSGVDAESGEVPGDTVDAVATVAFGWPKLGTVLHPGRARAGRLIAVEIGFPPPGEHPFPTRILTPGWADVHRPRRALVTHKGEVGGLLLLAGSPGLMGAAVFAARAALRSGVGYLRVASASEGRHVLQASVSGAVFVDASDRAALEQAVSSSRAVALGPGLGTGKSSVGALRSVLELSDGLPTVLDADALNLAASGEIPSLQEVSGGRPLLVTPHPGEMMRLAPLSREELKLNRPQVARRAAAEFGCTVLLKGAPSLVASPDGTLLIDGAGSSDLAVAGMGDVLTGSAGAFLAQGSDPSVAGGLALHYTGRAARIVREGPGLLPDDVIAHLRDALREYGSGETDLDLSFVTFDQDPPR